MGASQNIITDLSKDKYTIKAESTTTISFMGARPNYYQITNGGNTPLYLGVSMMPTENFFDMKIPSASAKLFVDAYGHDEIYIYNPSVTEANIIITSFSAKFDPSVLAMNGFGQDFSQIDFSGEVDAKGDLKTLLASIKTDLNSIKENSGEVDAKGDLKTLISNIKSDLDSIKEKINVPCTKWYKGTNTDAENMYTFKYINFLSNDSDSDLMVSISSTGNITLKPGEVLNNIMLDAVRTVIIPKYSTYRIIGG